MKAGAHVAIGIVIGLGCGVLITKKSPAPDPDRDTKSVEKQGSSALRSTLGSGTNTGPETGGGGKKTTTAGSGRSKSLAELLKFTSVYYNGSSLLDLYRAVEPLDPESLTALMKEIEEHPPSDQRLWQLRTTVLARLAQLDPESALDLAGNLKNFHTRNQAISSVVTEIAKNDLDAAMKILIGTEDRNEFKQLVNAIAASGTDGAAEAVLELALSRDQPNLDWSLNQIFSQVARTNLGAAFGHLDEIKEPQQRIYALEGIGSTITAENLETGLARLETLESNDRGILLGKIISTVAATDPQKALAIIGEHARRGKRRELLRNLGGAWLATDPAAARSWIESLDDPRDRIAALQNSSWTLASEDAGWLTEQIGNLPQNNMTRQLAGNVIQQLAGRDLEAARQFFDSLPPGAVRKNARQQLINELVSSDTEAAAELVASAPVDRNSSWSAGAIAGRLAITDPASAQEWLDSLDADESIRNQITTNMISHWAGTDPAGAASYALTLEGDQRGQAISSAISGWANRDYDAALDWVKQLDDPESRNRGMASIVTSNVHNDPERAAETFATATAGLTEEEVKGHFSSAANQIGANWAQYDPVAAATWAVDLPDSTNRPTVLQNVITQWATYEPKAASEWLTTFDHGPDRDAAVTGLVSQINASDPESAFAWAATIDDDGKRQANLTSAIRTWRNQDPDAARAAIEAGEFTDEVRTRLEKEVGGK